MDRSGCDPILPRAVRGVILDFLPRSRCSALGERIFTSSFSVGFQILRVLLGVLKRSSEELVGDFVCDDSDEAFRELVRRHLPMVYNAALRMANGDAHLAEDVSQVVFSDLASRAGKLPDGTIVAGWLYQHAWFTASKMIRTERRRELRERQSLVMDPNENSTDDGDLTQLGPILDEALTTLKPEDRDAIVLRFFDRADFERVGRALRISEDAAQKRVSRALEKL